jgi:glucose-1-phosphate adenylyltransferase
MDLISVHPVFDLYNRQWPIYTGHDPLPPAKFVFNEDGRRGQALDSMVSPGVIVSGGMAERSVLSPGAVLEAGSQVCDSVVLNDVRIGKGAMVRKAIIDKNVYIPDGARIGLDPEHDRARFTVTDEGVVVIGKNEIVEG